MKSIKICSKERIFDTQPAYYKDKLQAVSFIVYEYAAFVSLRLLEFRGCQSVPRREIVMIAT